MRMHFRFISRYLAVTMKNFNPTHFIGSVLVDTNHFHGSRDDLFAIAAEIISRKIQY